MVIIEIWGAPANVSEQDLEVARNGLPIIAGEVVKTTLPQERDAFKVFFPTDRVSGDAGNSITVVVRGLPDCGELLRDELASWVGRAAGRCFPRADRVDCLVEVHSPSSGFYSSSLHG